MVKANIENKFYRKTKYNSTYIPPKVVNISHHWKVKLTPSRHDSLHTLIVHPAESLKVVSFLGEWTVKRWNEDYQERWPPATWSQTTLMYYPSLFISTCISAYFYPGTSRVSLRKPITHEISARYYSMVRLFNYFMMEFEFWNFGLGWNLSSSKGNSHWEFYGTWVLI